MSTRRTHARHRHFHHTGPSITGDFGVLHITLHSLKLLLHLLGLLHQAIHPLEHLNALQLSWFHCVFYDLRAETCHQHLNARVSLDVGSGTSQRPRFRSA